VAPDDKKDVCPYEIVGARLRIVHCVDAWDSFLEALKSIPEARRTAIKSTMDLLVKRLSNGTRIAKDSFVAEGTLPSFDNKPAKSFYAFKKIPIRAYGWYSETRSGTFFISHYVYKDQTKLSRSDTNKVQGNWTRIEVNGDEK
jgi:hypothetical protein